MASVTLPSFVPFLFHKRSPPMSSKVKVKYFSAVILILTSITLAFVQVLDIDDVANGTLMYIAQAFLLAGSIFGLDYYTQKLTHGSTIIADE